MRGNLRIEIGKEETDNERKQENAPGKEIWRPRASVCRQKKEKDETTQNIGKQLNLRKESKKEGGIGRRRDTPQRTQKTKRMIDGGGGGRRKRKRGVGGTKRTKAGEGNRGKRGGRRNKERGRG